MNSKGIFERASLWFSQWRLVNSAFAAVLVYDQDFTTGLPIAATFPDGDPHGWQNSQVVSGLDNSLGILVCG
jgi:hypothetical protein